MSESVDGLRSHSNAMISPGLAFFFCQSMNVGSRMLSKFNTKCNLLALMHFLIRYKGPIQF